MQKLGQVVSIVPILRLQQRGLKSIEKQNPLSFRSLFISQSNNTKTETVFQKSFSSEKGKKSSSTSNSNSKKETEQTKPQTQAQAPVPVKEADKQVTAANKEGIIQSCKQDLASLAVKEVKIIQDALDSEFTNENGEVQQWLSKSGYKLTEQEEDAVLVKSDKLYTIKLAFSPHSLGEDDEEGLGDQEEENENGDDDDKDKDDVINGSEATDSEDDSSVTEGKDEDVQKELEKMGNRPVRVRADIIFNDKNGKPKGLFIVNGEVASDCRIYMDDIFCRPTTESELEDPLKLKLLNQSQSQTQTQQGQQQPKAEELNIALFDSLSQDMQDRIYDLLDELGVDDKMGAFIRYYVDATPDRNAIRNLQNLAKIFSDN